MTVARRNRLEPLQDVPLSISVVTGPELERLNAFDIESITRRAGNVVAGIRATSAPAASPSAASASQGQTEAQDPSVGIIVDGVNYAYNALHVELRFHRHRHAWRCPRGPQGTLLGKNASVGVINITTKRPSFTPSADYGVTHRPVGHGAGSPRRRRPADRRSASPCAARSR